MNWVNKLTNEDVLNIHRKVICSDTESVDVERENSGYIYVTAYENWPYEDGTPAYIPTNYTYYDTEYIDYDTSGVINNGKYRQELAKILGKEYLLDLFATLSEMDQKFIKEML